jgi:hypothetical protein
MLRAALTSRSCAAPQSEHSQRLIPSPAIPLARRTGLGTESFVGFDKHGPVPAGLVAEHVSEGGPPRVRHRLGHPGLLQGRRVHVADDDQTVFPNDPSGLFVKVVVPGIGDLGVDSPLPALVAGALGLAKRSLVFPVVLKRRNGLAVAQSGEFLQPEVNPDLPDARSQVVSNFALEGDIPAPASVLDESAGPELAADLPRLPEPEWPLQVGNGVGVEFGCAGNKRNPCQSALGAKAGAKPRANPVLVSGLHEAAANGAHSIGVQAKLSGAARSQLDQLEGRRPPDVEAPPCVYARPPAALRHRSSRPDCRQWRDETARDRCS